MGTLKTNQHYVWRHYLDAWRSDKGVWCHRKSERRSFRANPRNIASERFFYKAETLTAADVFYIEKGVIEQIKTSELRELANGYLSMFTLADRLERAVSIGSLRSEAKKRVSEELEKARRTMGEEYHAGLEDRCIKLLACLRQADCSFIDNEQSAIDFFHFLANQYFRTANLRQKICSIRSPVPGHSFERTWTIEAYIYACNVAASMFARRNVDLISFLKNSTETPFISGDQPVINLLNEKDQDIELYYPLSPTLALRLSHAPVVRDRKLTLEEVNRFNSLMFERAADQVFSNSETCLCKLADELSRSRNESAG